MDAQVPAGQRKPHVSLQEARTVAQLLALPASPGAMILRPCSRTAPRSFRKRYKRRCADVQTASGRRNSGRQLVDARTVFPAACGWPPGAWVPQMRLFFDAVFLLLAEGADSDSKRQRSSGEQVHVRAPKRVCRMRIAEVSGCSERVCDTLKSVFVCMSAAGVGRHGNGGDGGGGRTCGSNALSYSSRQSRAHCALASAWHGR